MAGQLEGVGFTLDCAAVAPQAVAQTRAEAADVIIVDGDRFAGDGLSVVPEWRRGGVSAYVLVLGESRGIEERVRLLDLGADDYLVKPVEPVELLAKLRAIARRTGWHDDAVVQIEDLVIDPRSHSIKRAGKEILLTNREFALLLCLARRRGHVVSRSLIWEQVFHELGDRSSNIIDVYIRYLRKKIDRGFNRPLIVTHRGYGYLLRDGEAR
jgi:DNA-binding response OmpR family regulator